MAQSIIRLFTDQPLKASGAAALSADQAHYLSRVMRKEVGTPVLLFNGTDGEWQGEIADIGKSRAIITVQERTREQVSSPDLWLLFAPVKRAPLDQIAQKATELGVSYLRAVKTERTIVSRVRDDRILANAIEAAEQCERLDVPAVEEFAKMMPILERWGDEHPDRKLIFCDEAGDAPDERWGGAAGRAKPIAEALTPFQSSDAKWAILIGPEGGFSPKERDFLRARDFVIPVTLGPRILRADTAAFAAITLWQSILGDFTKA